MAVKNPIGIDASGNLYEMDATDLATKNPICLYSGQLKELQSGDSLPGSGATAWTRPADWLTFTDPAAGEEKFVGLHAVWPTDGNFVAFTFAGGYTVDWGDGSAPENVASGNTAYHEYTYSSISAATESTRGYRQVIVTVTPQAGANLSSMNLFVKHNQSGLVNGYSTGWLDISARLPNLTSLTIGSNTTTVRFNMLEQVKLLDNGTVTSFANLFFNVLALQSLVLDDTSAVTNVVNMFRSCDSLQTVPLFDTSAVTDMSDMFRDCGCLQTVPLFDTSAVSIMGNMFNSCVSLSTIPALDASAATSSSSYGSMFTNCFSLASNGFTGHKFTFSVANNKLSAAALDTLYTNLATVVGQTITVTGNYGTAADDPTIATNKGWTVTG